MLCKTFSISKHYLSNMWLWSLTHGMAKILTYSDFCNNLNEGWYSKYLATGTTMTLASENRCQLWTCAKGTQVSIHTAEISLTPSCAGASSASILIPTWSVHPWWWVCSINKSSSPFMCTGWPRTGWVLSQTSARWWQKTKAMFLKLPVPRLSSNFRKF